MAVEHLPKAEWEEVTPGKYVATFAGIFKVTVIADWEDDFWWVYFEIGDRLIGRDQASTIAEGKAKAIPLIKNSLGNFLEELKNSH